MIPPLGKAIVTLLRAHVPALYGRAYNGGEPLAFSQTPLVTLTGIDWSIERTLGASMSRGEARIRITDEETQTPSSLADIEGRIDTVLTGNDPTVPALVDVEDAEGLVIMHGWHVENIERLGSKGYAENADGHRYAHTILDYEVLCQLARPE